MLAGLWFGASAFAVLLILAPWEDDRFRGKGTLWLVPGVLLRFLEELIWGEHNLLFVPVAIVLVFGALIGGRILDRENAYPNILALTLGGVIGMLTVAVLFVAIVAGATVRDYRPGIRTFIFFLIYLGAIWGYYHLILAAFVGALSGWLLYRCRVLVSLTTRLFARGE